MFWCMQADGLQPNRYTFVSLLKACASIPELEEGKRIHAEGLKYSCGPDLFVCTSPVHMYAKCGSILDAKCFCWAVSRGTVSWSAMPQHMLSRGNTTVPANGRRRCNCKQTDLCLHTPSMLHPSREGSQRCCGGQWANVTALEMGKAIHAYARRNGYDKHVFVANTPVCMYGCVGALWTHGMYSTYCLRGVWYHGVQCQRRISCKAKEQWHCSFYKQMQEQMRV